MIRKDLSTVCGLLCSLFHVSLQNKLEIEADYQLMVARKRHNSMMLHQLIKKMCNGSTSVVVEEVLGNLVEALHNFVLIRGEEHDTLPKCMESSQNRYEVLKMAGFEMVTEELRDTCMQELRSRGKCGTTLHAQLLAWSNATDDAKEKHVKDAGRKALTGAFRARI